MGKDHNFEITFPTRAGYVKLRHSFIADLGFYNANKMMWNDPRSDISRLAERHRHTETGEMQIPGHFTRRVYKDARDCCIN